MTEDRGAPHAIVTSALTRQFNGVTALDNVSFQVDTGSIFGFLGPNGAGKTTTIKLLLGFIKPSSGRSAIFGRDTWHDGVAARKSIGFLVPADSFYPEMSGRSQLDFAASLSQSPALRRRELLDVLELSDRDLDRKLGKYSKGMKQKLALTAAAQHDPPLLILDEPTDGLDPVVQRNFEDYLRDIHHQGRTIFMSSHDLAEVERICQAVAIVREGKLVALEQMNELQQRRLRQVTFTVAEGSVPDFQLIGGVNSVWRDGDRWLLSVEGNINPLIEVLSGLQIDDLTISPPSLDDIFMTFYRPEGTDIGLIRDARRRQYSAGG